MLFRSVVAAKATACAGVELTKAAMQALQAKANPEDVIEAAQGGFQEAGLDLPKAWGSNLRRVAKAEGDYAQRIIDSGRALNNDLLVDLGVPKATNAGAKTKADKPKADKPKADKPKADKPKAEAANDAINLGTLDRSEEHTSELQSH